MEFYIDMNGPYSLTDDNIDKNVIKKSIGNYALGYLDENNEFIIQYVGRSDNDLNERLKNWVNKKYKNFMFINQKTIVEAYVKECRDYHLFNPKDNDIHPRKPDNSKDKFMCPFCIE
jgi:hypothetical protein